jgi:putative nucleotidyltransferase with HDIG domain
MFGMPRKQSRLGQWDGRTRSSRNDRSVLARIRRAPVLLRLIIILETVAAITVLSLWLGPPLAYRVGQICSSDLRVRAYFEVVNDALTEQAREDAIKAMPAAAAADPQAREHLRFAVPPVVEKYPLGTLIVPRGQPITEAQRALLAQEFRAYLHSLTPGDQARRALALCLVMGLLATVAVLYAIRFQQALADSLAKVAGVCVLVIATMALALIGSGPPFHASIIPLTLTAMILTVAYNPQFALLMSFSLTLATTVAMDADLDYLLIQMGGLATAILLLRDVRSRSRLVHVGICAGLAYLAATVATGLLSGQTWRLICFESGRYFLWGSLAGFLMTGILPLVERSFNVVTDVSLLELADGSHPLLQELIRRAPGTYTHSMTVATLAEAAAEAIGANPLMTRVGSYFHDVGKMIKPQYFIENQTGQNRHDDLEPALSTLVIIGHIKDGVALAKKYRLPSPIIDFIEQHHGTTLVEYFYREALRLQEPPRYGAPEWESAFRYPGPKPQNRENGIVMLADAVESSSRALRDPAPGSLRKLVHDLVMKRLLDGQFEESSLTLTDLHLVEQSLSKSLVALYHGRIKYPPEDEQSSPRLRLAS